VFYIGILSDKLDSFQATFSIIMGVNFLQDQDPADPEEILELLSNFKSSTFEENFDLSQQVSVL
jgi:hypothetical protein